MNQEVGQIKPRAVYMVAYCRRGGMSDFAERPAEAGPVEDLDADDEMGEVGVVAGAAGSSCQARWNKLTSLQGSLSCQGSGQNSVCQCSSSTGAVPSSSCDGTSPPVLFLSSPSTDPKPFLPGS